MCELFLVVRPSLEGFVQPCELSTSGQDIPLRGHCPALCSVTSGHTVLEGRVQPCELSLVVRLSLEGIVQPCVLSLVVKTLP